MCYPIDEAHDQLEVEMLGESLLLPGSAANNEVSDQATLVGSLSGTSCVVTRGASRERRPSFPFVRSSASVTFHFFFAISIRDTDRQATLRQENVAL